MDARSKTSHCSGSWIRFRNCLDCLGDRRARSGTDTVVSPVGGAVCENMVVMEANK